MDNYQIFMLRCLAIFSLPCLINGAHRYRANRTSTFPAWAFPCRCNTSCDTETGACLDGGVCTGGLPEEYPWQDKQGHTGCRYGNVAYNKIATQSGLNYDNFASRAVDGNTDSDLVEGASCAHPQLDRGGHAWWQVDLQDVYEITEIRLYNRAYRPLLKRMSYFYLKIGNTTSLDNAEIIDTYTEPPVDASAVYSDTYDNNYHYGRVITFQRYGNKNEPHLATLCEVVIIGRRTVDCSLCDPISINCDNYDGCQRCSNGKKLPDCREGCDQHYYGENCEGRCSDQCIPGGVSPCDSVTGICQLGCNEPVNMFTDTWYMGERCDIQVPRLQFGRDDKVENASAITDHSVSMKWKESTLVDEQAAKYIGYNIYISTTGNNYTIAHKVLYNVSGGQWQEAVITGLDSDTTYWIHIAVFRIYSDRKVYESGFRSGNITFKTTPAPTTIPTTISTMSTSKSPNNANIRLIGGATGGTLAVILIIILLIFVIYRCRLGTNETNNEQSTVIERRNNSDGQYVNVKPKRISFAQLKAKFPGRHGQGANNDAESAFTSTPEVQPTRKHNVEENTYHNIGQNIEESTEITMSDLNKFIAKQKQETAPFSEEYQSIPNGPLLAHDIASKSENSKKNKFKNIPAYDTTRVILDDVKRGEPDYINANYISGYSGNTKEYVATQAPQPHTVNEFWSMVWQVQSTLIVMLTKQVEMGVTKCREYWAEEGQQEKQYDNIRVRTVEKVECADFVMRKIKLKKGDDTKTITQLQYLRWPDKRAPDFTFHVLNFLYKVRSIKATQSGPTVVHCSAGVGRTGTLIAIDFLLQQAESEGQVDVVRQVHQMRLERIKMVQIREQYEFIYDALLDANECGQTAIKTADVKSKYQEMQCNREAGINKQWKIMDAQRQNRGSARDGINKENAQKNRDPDIIPDERYRPILSTKCANRNLYINAILSDTYESENSLYVTQHPLPDTVVDFWRLVYDKKCSTIVMLDKVATDDQSMPVYWPDGETSEQEHGPLKVTFRTKESYTGIEMREFQVSTKKKGGSPFTTTQFQMKDWDYNDLTPDPMVFLTLLDKIHNWNRKCPQNSRTLVHCLNGAMKSGLYCAATYMLDKQKIERLVDPLLAVRYVYHARPQFVNRKEQYKFLFELAIEAEIKAENMYANV